MAQGGFIKLARCLLDKPLFHNSNLLQVWVWCLLKATHKPHTQLVGLRKIDLLPGQFITGRKAGSEELEMAATTFWRNLLWLQNNNSISIKPDSKFSLVTIVNWEVYQVSDSKDGQQVDSKWTASGQQVDTNKNVKKDKNEKKKIYSENIRLTDAEFQRLVSEFGQTMTTAAIEYLSNYKIEKGYTSKDDNRTLRRWVFDAVGKKQPPKTNSYMDASVAGSKMFLEGVYGNNSRNGSQDISDSAGQLPAKIIR